MVALILAGVVMLSVGGARAAGDDASLCGVPGGACAASQVATHNISRNCWVMSQGSYFIATAFVVAAPGGSAVFSSSWCGRDIGASLDEVTMDRLSSYRVGPVQ